MTGRYEKTVNRFRGGPDPFEDTLVVVWDAVVRGKPETPMGCDPQDTAVVRRIQALETIPPPSDTFFDDLERQLAGLASQPAVESSTLAAASTFELTRKAAITPPRVPWPHGDTKSSGAPSAIGRTTAFPGATRRLLSTPATAAVLALLLIAGPLVFYLAHGTPSEPPAIPAAVVPAEMETVVRFDFTPSLWDMPAASTWDHLELSLFSVAPGASFSTDIPWYTSVEGPLMIAALNGNLGLQPLGPALVYRDGSPSDAPVEQPAGESLTLGPYDAIVLSSAATATGTNTGKEPVLILVGLAGGGGNAALGTLTEPDDLTRVDVNLEEHLSPLPGDGASVSIRHLRLAPLDAFVYDIEPGLRIIPIYVPMQINDLRIYDGALDPFALDLTGRSHYASRAFLLYPDPGPHTLVNISDDTVDLYFLVAEPLPGTSTPAE
jgi:hypothetical protein